MVFMAGLVELPEFREPEGILLEDAIQKRRSKCSGWKEKISLSELSRLLWSAQGRTDDLHRSVPSAGATYPLEVFVAAKKVESLPEGVYRYIPERHGLEKVGERGFSEKLAQACGKYSFVCDAPMCIIICADFSRTTSRYGERGIRYVHMEVGSAYQNISLEAVNLGLGTVVVGAFDDKAAKDLTKSGFSPLCILPVG